MGDKFLISYEPFDIKGPKDPSAVRLVFTDGSRRPVKNPQTGEKELRTGCAVYMENHVLKKTKLAGRRLPNTFNNHDAEYMAVALAADLISREIQELPEENIKKMPEERICFITDAQNVLTSMGSPAKSKERPTVRRCRWSLLRLKRQLDLIYGSEGDRIHLQYVRAHMKNPGNECADKAAKRACISEKIFNPIS